MVRKRAISASSLLDKSAFSPLAHLKNVQFIKRKGAELQYPSQLY
jgi:hypothetical protein